MSKPTSNILKFQKPSRTEADSQGTQNPIRQKSAQGKGATKAASGASKSIGKSQPAATSGTPTVIPTAYARRSKDPMFQMQQRRIARARSLWASSLAVAKRIFNIALLLLLLIGAGTVWDAGVGDGALPRLNALSQSAPELVRVAQSNSTAHLPISAVKTQDWESLSASRTLLLSLSPQIAYWLFTLHQQGHIVARTPDDIHQTYHVSADTPLLAAYRHSENRLYLGESFWQLSDGEKVAVIAHEYRHSRQNPGKRLGYQLAQFMSLGQLHHETPMENEAMDYERQARTALGIQ